MITRMSNRIESGVVIELDHDGVWISAIVLLANEEAIILDACDDSTPFLIRPIDLVRYRLFRPEAA